MKKTGIITLVAVVILLLVVSLSLVSGTYARYLNKVTGKAEAVAAAWSFAATGFGTTETPINLYDTITNAATTYPNLTEDTIAPGTSGSFNITVDGTGSEVGIEYSILISKAAGSAELPAGLTITTKLGAAEPTSLDFGTPITGKIALEDVATPVVVTVAWNWALGDDANATEGIDNVNAGNSYALDVVVKGEQFIGTI